MLRRGLQVLLGAVMLWLAAIVGIAVLRVRGPDDVLGEAQRLMTRGAHLAAAQLLQQAERSPALRADASRHERLLRLRLQANTELGRVAEARRDLDELVRSGRGETDALQLDAIRLLAMAGDGDGARAAALAFLQRRPEHSRALELAGEACQTIYQPLLHELLQRLDRDLPRLDREPARAAVLAFVYRPDGDAEVAAALATLRRLHERTPRLGTRWREFERDLQPARERVQEALDFSQRSVASGGEPVAAFRAVALALDQSDRIDDLLLQCEIHRRRFRHVYADEAGAASAWALVRTGQYAAALATCERWLIPGSTLERLAQNRIGAGTNELMLARAWSAWQLQDRDALLRAWGDVAPLFERKRTGLHIQLTGALLQAIGGDLANAIPGLGMSADYAVRRPPPIGQVDLVPAIVRLRLELQQQAGAPEGDVQAALRVWQRARPASIEPDLALATILQDRGQAVAALAALDGANARAPGDPRVFELRLELLRRFGQTTGQDGPALLQQCVRRGIAIPEVRDPVGYLLCGEAALAQRSLWIAGACARAATDAFPHERAPRLLAIRVALADDRAADAAAEARSLLDLLPPDADTLALARSALRAAGLPGDHLLAPAMATMAPEPSLQAELLRHALARRAATALEFAPPAASAADAPPGLRVLTAHALAAAGRADAAGDLLAAAAPAADLVPPADAARAFAAWITAAAGDDAVLATEVARRTAAWPALAGGDPAVVAAAAAMGRDRPRTALELLRAALQHTPAAARTGQAFRLAADLAARLGEWRDSETYGARALAFADAGDAAETLARRALAHGDGDRAQRWWAAVALPGDAALAARFGRADAAAALLAADAARDGTDLLLQATLAAIGLPALVDWRPDPALAHERLELLACLRDPATARLLLPRLAALVERDPAGRTGRLLLARARAHAGDLAAAQALHAELHAASPVDPVLWREVAYCAAVPGYEVDAQLAVALVAARRAGLLAAAPATATLALELERRECLASGDRSGADALRAEAFAGTAPPVRFDAEDLEAVCRTLPPAAATALLERVLQAGSAVEPERVLDRMAALAPAAGDAGLAAVRRAIDHHGARGAAVHLLLPPLRGDSDVLARRRALLHAHLDAVAAGADDAAWLVATVRELRATEGAEAAVAALDERLQRAATALDLWQARAELVRGTADEAPAIARLRAALRHVDAPERQLAAITLAAEARQQTPADAATFAALPPAVRDSAAGGYAGALLALRAGRPDDALAGLAAAPPREDGMHLVLRALAELQGRADDAVPRALAALQQLERDYRSSSLARSAGSFVRQLSPR